MTHPIPRQPAPSLEIGTLDGPWQLSDQVPDRFSMIVVYRGLHCPICKQSLRQLEQMLDDFAALGVQVIALSADTKDRAQKAKDDWGLTNLRIGYGLSEDTARQWGLFVSTAISDKEPDRFAEPGVFLVRPDGELYAAAIQSMPFARPAFEDLQSAIEFIAEKDYPARGEA